jgi:hypothetical protein
MIAAAAATVVVWLVVGRRYTIRTDPSIDLGDHRGRHVGIMSSLAGFAVTGLVLPVTVGRTLTVASSTTYTTLLIMFLVAYMGYFATSVMFANVAQPDHADFNVPAAAYTGAATTMYFTILIGWLALRPMFQTFGPTRAAGLTSWLLVGAAIGGYGLFAQHLHKSGYASGPLTILIALLGGATTLIFAFLVAWFGLGSADSTLYLTVAALIVGSVATAGLGVLRVLATSAYTARPLAKIGPFLILGYAQGAVVLIGFLLLSVLGLA